MENENTTPCSFCDAEVRSIQEITRNDLALAIYPHRPIIDNHVMIMPLRHVEKVEELSKEEIIAIFDMIKTISGHFKGITGFNLFTNNGKSAGQNVPHIHFHIFGRSESEEISPYTILNNLKAYNLPKLEQEEIKKRIQNLLSTNF